jgi:dihydrolipoamide dehydrogenase
MMSGVSNAKNHIELMGFGFVNTPAITNSLLWGGILSVNYLGTLVWPLDGGWVGEKVGRIKSQRPFALGAAWGSPGASLQFSAQNHI